MEDNMPSESNNGIEKNLQDSGIEEMLNVETAQMEIVQEDTNKVNINNNFGSIAVKRKADDESAITELDQDKESLDADNKIVKKMRTDSEKESVDENQGHCEQKDNKIEFDSESTKEIVSVTEEEPGSGIEGQEQCADGSNKHNTLECNENDIEQLIEQEINAEQEQNKVDDEQKIDSENGNVCSENNEEQACKEKNNEQNDEQEKNQSASSDEQALAVAGCSTWSDEQCLVENNVISENQESICIKQEQMDINYEDEKIIMKRKMRTMESIMKNLVTNIVESSNEGVKRKFSEEMEVLRAQLVDARAERRKAQNLEEMVSNLKKENKQLKEELEKERGQRKNFERIIAKLEKKMEKLQNQKAQATGSDNWWMEPTRYVEGGVSLSESDNEAKAWGISMKVERKKEEEQLTAKKHPEPLPTRADVEVELKERETRLNNVIMKGMEFIGRKTLNKVNLMMEEEIGWRLRIEDVMQIGSKTLLLKMESKHDKTELMNNRSRFLKWGLTLENDLTTREKEVQEWIQDIVETEQERGRESCAKHLRVFLRGKWYLWDERKAKLV